MIRTIGPVTIEYDGKPLDAHVTAEIGEYHLKDLPEQIPFPKMVGEWSIPISGTLTPEGEAFFDHLHWDAWRADVMATIDAGEVIPACAAVLKMLRFCVSVQLSDYGADTAKSVINAFSVKYGLDSSEAGE